MDGILNIDKPFGKTSYSVVAVVKRLSGERHVGHGGTLDPAATGVLPIGLGRGTKVIEFLLSAPKAYRTEIELGVTTDTYDMSGRVIQRRDPSGISQNRLESALGCFYGLIQQIPPMYSAVKYQGKPLYKLARAGITVERRSRSVRIYRLSLLNWEPPVATVEIICGKGTYIRSLVHDLGQALDCGACVKSLIRLRCGSLDIKDAVSLSQLEEAFLQDNWRELINPVDSVLSHWAAVFIGDEAIDDIRNGRPLILKNDEGDIKNNSMDAHEQDRCRAYTLDGRFLGVLRFNAGSKQWQAEKVFL